MSSWIELHTWRLASSYFGTKDESPIFEDYQLQKFFVRVYMIQDSWIQKQGIPSKFFDAHKEKNGAVGCIKTSFVFNDGTHRPCIMFDMRITSKKLKRFSPEMDPVLFFISEIYADSLDENFLIYQSIENPFHIGVVRNCPIETGVPLPWEKEDIGQIFGIGNTSEEDSFV